MYISLLNSDDFLLVPSIKCIEIKLIKQWTIFVINRKHFLKLKTLIRISKCKATREWEKKWSRSKEKKNKKRVLPELPNDLHRSFSNPFAFHYHPPPLPAAASATSRRRASSPTRRHGAAPPSSGRPPRADRRRRSSPWRRRGSSTWTRGFRACSVFRCVLRRASGGWTEFGDGGGWPSGAAGDRSPARGLQWPAGMDAEGGWSRRRSSSAAVSIGHLKNTRRGRVFFFFFFIVETK